MESNKVGWYHEESGDFCFEAHLHIEQGEQASNGIFLAGPRYLVHHLSIQVDNQEELQQVHKFDLKNLYMLNRAYGRGA